MTTASPAYPGFKNMYSVMFVFKQNHGLLIMSLRNVCFDTIGITLLSEHAVFNYAFDKTHKTQRIAAERLIALLYV